MLDISTYLFIGDIPPDLFKPAILLIIAGVVCLLIAILGKIDSSVIRAEVPTPWRVLSLVLGISMIGSGLFLDDRLMGGAVSGNATPKATHSMSNEELREGVKQLATSMRNFEKDARFKSDSLELQRHGGADQPSWDKYMSETLNLRTAEQTDFRNGYLADAHAYRDEILLRLNEVTPDREKYIIALQGQLAGPTPVADLADYLEWLSKQLPQ